jgi:MFS family permease
MPEASRTATPGASLWTDSAFLKLWTALTMSRIGTQVTFMALPLTAVLFLDASPSQVGWLSMVEYLPYLLSLWAGVLVDRFRRRPILVAANLTLGFLVGIVPAAALTDHLSYQTLLAVAFGAGCVTMLTEIAQASYLPTLLGPEKLLEGNSKLQVGRATAQMSGAGLGGLLIQALTAPIAIAADSASYLLSAFLIGRISKPEPPPSQQASQLRVELQMGVRMALDGPLRPLLALAAMNNLFLSTQGAIFILYLARELAFPPMWIGITSAASSIGGVLMGFATGRAHVHWDVRRLLAAQVSLVVCVLLIPAASHAPPLGALVIMVFSSFLFGAANVVLFVSILTGRQALTPHGTLGRVSAAWAFLGVAVTALGAALGGYLGQTLGLGTTFLLCGLGLCLPLLVVSRVPEPTSTEDGGGYRRATNTEERLLATNGPSKRGNDDASRSPPMVRPRKS